jgi:tryptophan 2,3-dioxygenase
MKNHEPVEYTDYLALDNILSSQKLVSEKNSGKPAHEEMLFILTHQTYELWFKQIIWEIDSILTIFSEKVVSDQNLSKVVHRLKRVNEIWRVLISQITVLETMTPMEFLSFRNHLYPASGFQSAQFRLIENKLGLEEDQREMHGGCPYHQFLKTEDKPAVEQAASSTSLLRAVEAWLERTPYLKTEGYDFWSEYKKSVDKMLDQEEQLINENPSLNKIDKEKSLAAVSVTRSSFKNFMNKEDFDNNKSQGEWRLSFEALQSALFIQLYRHELKLQSANRLIETLIDLDENMTQWRNRHAQMALRMLGQKMGTGGSSGEAYLKAASDKHKIFMDFFKLTTFFIEDEELKKAPHL